MEPIWPAVLVGALMGIAAGYYPHKVVAWVKNHPVLSPLIVLAVVALLTVPNTGSLGWTTLIVTFVVTSFAMAFGKERLIEN